MTYQNIQNEQLCNKLRSEFSNRLESKINASRNVRPSGAPVRVRSAIREFDSTYAATTGRTENDRRTAASSYAEPEMKTRPAKKEAAGRNKADTNASYRGENGQSASVEERKTFDYLYNKYAGMRSFNKRFDENKYEARNPEATKKERKIKEKKAFSSRFKENIKEFFAKDDEGMVARTDRTHKIPKSFVACVVVATALLLTVLYTSSVYSSTSSEVKALRDEQTQLMAERDKLVNLLGVKDDIREIEDYAVNEIGMVKSDYVETRYVSIAGGEHIDVIAADREDEGNIFSTLLSAVGGNWDRLMDYID